MVHLCYLSCKASSHSTRMISQLAGMAPLGSWDPKIACLGSESALSAGLLGSLKCGLKASLSQVVSPFGALRDLVGLLTWTHKDPNK